MKRREFVRLARLFGCGVLVIGGSVLGDGDGDGGAAAAPSSGSRTKAAETAKAAKVAQPAAAASAPERVDIPAGCVTVGPARPHHALTPRRVCLPAFRLDRAEVTVAQHRACVAAGACTPPPPHLRLCNANVPGRADHPANCATYEEAVRFCEWRGARLPTPDEWERAARGPGMTTYPWGEAAPTPTLAVMPVDEDRSTAPVCSRSAGHSAEGLCDLAGNVAEWTAGYWIDTGLHPAPADAVPGRDGVPVDGSHMTRGGSFGEAHANLRGWMRQRVPAKAAPSPRNGIRCATDE